MSKFDRALLKAVDETFYSLGETVQKAMYFHLETTFRIKKREVPRKVEDLDEALRMIFKDGTIFLERMILEKMCKELEVKFEEKANFDFVEAISEIRHAFSKREFSLAVPFIEKENVLANWKHRGGKD